MIKIDIKVPLAYTDEDIKDAVMASIPIMRSELCEIHILKKALFLDNDKGYALTVALSLSEDRESGLLKMRKKVFAHQGYELSLPKAEVSSFPTVVVGAGPAGLFAALTLAECGVRVVVIERGESVEKRQRTVGKFFAGGELDEESNVQFGEGGAGAFSDGKLKFGGMDEYKYKVLSEFVKAGAPEEILYTKGAHLGTDKLPRIVREIREKIKSLGGEFIFRARLTDIKIKDGRVRAAVYERDGKCESIETERIVLATGHSASDTFDLLLRIGAPMEARGFGIGVRIEHPREYINNLVYKDEKIADLVGTASYHLVTHLPSGRSVYSFCMCPGGVVVAAASGKEGIVTNGMSEYARDAENSNAAHLVSLTPRDFGSDSPLAGIELQRKIERAAYIAGGGGYLAPAIRMDDFLQSTPTLSDMTLSPSYSRGVTKASPDKYLPEFITDSLREGIADFDKWMPGFYYPEAILTGAETRSTSPVRVMRNERYTCPTVEGLYPIGEGAGYAGGIVSSGVDGVRAALSIAREMQKKI